MPLVLGTGLDGATTVSGTMLLAARAGIRVFVTGGIGGVHRWGAWLIASAAARLACLQRARLHWPLSGVCRARQPCC